MQTRRKFFHKCAGDPKRQKALAIAIMLKVRLGRTSTLRNYTVNKIHQLTGLSPATIKKYIPLMMAMGLTHTQGRNNEHLVVNKLASHTRGRNIDISQFDFSSVKEIYYSLRAFLVMAVQAKKDFVRHALHASRNPSSHKELKRARKKKKSLVKAGVISGMDAEYREYGLSHARMARETGNCLRTAFSIKRYAAKKGWWRKERHQIRYHVPGISYRDTGEFFTYATKDYLVINLANTYTLSQSIYHATYLWG